MKAHADPPLLSLLSLLSLDIQNPTTTSPTTINMNKIATQMRNSQLPKAQRKPDYLRPMWVAGMAAYM